MSYICINKCCWICITLLFTYFSVITLKWQLPAAAIISRDNSWSLVVRGRSYLLCLFILFSFSSGTFCLWFSVLKLLFAMNIVELLLTWLWAQIKNSVCVCLYSNKLWNGNSDDLVFFVFCFLFLFLFFFIFFFRERR